MCIHTYGSDWLSGLMHGCDDDIRLAEQERLACWGHDKNLAFVLSDYCWWTEFLLTEESKEAFLFVLFHGVMSSGYE